MESDMSTGIYLLTLTAFFGTILVVFGMKYFSAASSARARIAGDAAYRTLAEKTLAVQSETQAALATVQVQLARLSASVAAVETILKQVE
jgi:hypothetical protein